MSKLQDNYVDELLKTFTTEGHEQIYTISQALLKIESSTDMQEKQLMIDTAYRALHNLKGSARGARFSSIESFCHALESIFYALKFRELEPSKKLLDLLFKSIISVEQLLSLPQTNILAKPMRRLLDELLAQARELDLKETSQNEFADKNTIISSITILETNWSSEEQTILKTNSSTIFMEEDRKQSDRTSSRAQTKTRRHPLMMPCSSLFNSFKLPVSDLAQDLEKEVEFVIEGGELEIDKRLLREIKDPLNHALRNSIDHGIEHPNERIAQGKPRQAKIILSAKRLDEGTIQIKISDDGRGINIKKIKNKALDLNIHTAQELEIMPSESIEALIFKPYFSTTDSVSEISGRGIGLSILEENVKRLGGRIELVSVLAQGTSITMTFPTPKYL